MAAILTADELVTRFIFQDNRCLTVDDVRFFLTNRQQVSDGVRCYEYIMGLYEEKGQHFDPQFSNIDQWGEVEFADGERYLNFHVNAFVEQLKAEGFSRKSFTSWAKREGLLRCNSGDRDTYVKRQKQQPSRRFVSIKMVDLDEYEADKDMFK